MLSLSMKNCRSWWLPTSNYYCRFYAKLSKAKVAQVAEENKEFIANVLGVSPQCAQRILQQNPSVANANPQNMQLIPKILEKYRLPPQLHITSPFILTVPPSYLESQIIVYRETGINYKDPTLLKRFKNIVRIWIDTLRKNNVIPPEVNVVENYIKALPISEEHTSFIHGFVPANAENIPLRQLRISILVPYIAILLNCDTAVSQNIIKLYPRIAMRSFCWIYQSAKILKENFEFDDKKIQKHGYLFLLPPDKLRNLHESVKTLAGVPLVELVLARPKILGQSPENLQQIERNFQMHGIPLSSVSKYPEVFTLSEPTVRHRLNEMERIPELKVFKSHPRVVQLIYFQTKAKKRLIELDSQLLSLNTLSAGWKRYQRFLDEKARWRGLDIFTFLQSRIPGKSLTEFRRKLKDNPNWLSCNIVNMKEVLDYLQVEEKVDDAIIFEALPIVLYPSDKIKLAFQEVISSREAQITDSYFLHMVLYMLEKAVHFSGDGVWPIDMMAVPDFDLEGDDEFEDIQNVDEDVELEEDDLDGVADDLIDDDELIE